MNVNLHCKDWEGNHRIVEGDTSMLSMTQRELRRMLIGVKIYATEKRPVLGCVIGGRLAQPEKQ